MLTQKQIIGLLLALTCGIPAGSAAAATATTTFQVTTNVNATCAIQAADLVFANYTVAQVDAQAQIQVVCTNTSNWTIGLDAGTFPGATVTTRAMTGPTTFSLNYQLFADPARTINWGNTVGTDTVTGTGNGAVEIVNVYGRIPASQTPAVGGYVDTITATVTF